MWVQFQRFSNEQVVGLTNVTVFNEVASLSPMGLYHLERMRSSNFTALHQEVRCDANTDSILKPIDALNELLERQPRLLFQLPSAWHYVPNYYHEMQQYTPFAGLFSPYDIRHPCPSTPEKILDYVLGAIQSNRMDEQIGTSSFMDVLLSDVVAELPSAISPFYVTPDTSCGQSIFILHCTSTFKQFPWARRLLEYWGAKAPKPYKERAARDQLIFGLRPSDFEWPGSGVLRPQAEV
eukprot:TRINITY_DN24265_c0_g1_i2.p1 TRINITY_DN24265_c0_g1~~TRINITY_DN24265_c0_g1_i2.p1  ORF type:complete len:237 (-),score=11.11 TRINITY_DN24265_c0_g1_i2:32-742(-)